MDEIRVRTPSVALFDRGDTEQTRLTRIAQSALEYAIEGRSGRAHPAQFAQVDSGQWIVVEVHGQSSVTGHGKQGLRPGRIAFLRELRSAGFPVWLAFLEGYESYRWAWLHDLPAAVPLKLTEAGAPDSGRFGWPARLLQRETGPLTLPTCVPPPAPASPQGQLV